ncbi:galactose mutarotase-like isoform X1 [Euwallacea similis]|uniref:galactose mutarotase-like isoform X1 n=1 Tax=Euwallacea similis TaxID=1736056 RepID=UPI00344EAD58
MECIKIAKKPAVWLTVDNFGTYKNDSGVIKHVERFTWQNVNNITVQVINWGATITSIKIPDKDGNIEDIVTGFDSIEEYLSTKNRYYGATIGRVANRTARGELDVEGVNYKLAINNGPNHLHGGIQGFDKVLWNYHVSGNKLILTYLSKDMEEGYPGDVLATITFQLTHNNEFHIDYRAVATRTTPINLTNHSYFNLGGHGSGSKGLYQHEITINADRYTEVDKTAIPTGNLPSVNGTIFDLRIPKLLGEVISKVPNSPGYDHNYCITKATSQDVAFVAKAYHRPSGRIMEVYSNQPGVQFYTGNFMPEDKSSQGKGAIYQKHGAFCLETQIYPDAIHHANFPDVLIKPGEEYHQFTSFKFIVQK